MKHVLSKENVDLLAQIAWSHTLLAFDFDGTLAPIVSNREQAVMREKTMRLFAKACKIYPCAVISGRSQKDVATRLNGSTVKYIIGNHGLEPGSDITQFEAQIAEVRPLLEKSLEGHQGIDIEDKRYSLAIHYRKSRGKTEARKAILDAIHSLPIAMRLINGKLVVNLVPEKAPNKGDALLELREKESASTALYVGDDVTDEDVFEIDQPGRLVSIRVGVAKSSSATFFLRNQKEIDTLLGKLVTFRERYNNQ